MTFFRKFIDLIPEKYEPYYRIVVVLICILLITWMYPRERKFKYEFQRGKPWVHETLIAPFDFPIYKQASRIQLEKDSLIDHLVPYFVLQDSVQLHEIDQFKLAFASYWKQYSLTHHWTVSEGWRSKVSQHLVGLFEDIYTRGVLEPVENVPYKSIKVVRNKIADEMELDECFTQKSAYEYLMSQIKSSDWAIARDSLAVLQTMLKGFRFNEYIEPNLFYDLPVTNRELKSVDKKISLTEGMVQAGERIIMTGDVISDQTYRILESLKKDYESKLVHRSAELLIGQFFTVAVLLVMLFLYLSYYRREVFRNRVKVSFIFILMVLSAIIARLVLEYNSGLGLYAIPFTILPILIKTFYDSRLANFVLFVNAILIGLWAPNSFEFVYLNSFAGVIAVLSLSQTYKRGRLFFTSLYIYLAYTVAYLSFSIIQEGSFQHIEYRNLVSFAVNCVLVLSALPLMYVFEKLFGFVSDATLLEISDTNQPLLRKLAETAPGTFQHSLQVANLAEEAIYAIHGNTLLVRVGALYHDIGKVENPVYFIENQSDGFNPHDNLSFEQSAEVIIRHVEAGVEIAQKHRLPEVVIDFIRTHHGTSTVHYFYRSYLKNYPNEEVDVSRFQYPGAKPFSKEMAVLMMADSIEAASRSLRKYDDEIISTLVDDIILQQMKEEQYNDSDITYKEITQVKNIFKHRLRTIYHKRVEYPKV